MGLRINLRRPSYNKMRERTQVHRKQKTQTALWVIVCDTFRLPVSKVVPQWKYLSNFLRLQYGLSQGLLALKGLLLFYSQQFYLQTVQLHPSGFRAQNLIRLIEIGITGPPLSLCHPAITWKCHTNRCVKLKCSIRKIFQQ